VLLGYSWPGNVRELRNMIEQAVLLNTGSVIGAPQLTLSHLGSTSSSMLEPTDAAAKRAPSELTLPEMERQALVHALQLTDGNVTRAARELGISRDTLRYRIEKHGLDTPQRPGFRDTH
jgi:two-component system, NtrC family, response regulator AtoC